MANKPQALYLHIPFCEHICDYCDFPKLQYFTTLAKDYLGRLQEELDSYQIKHQLKSIYIGGGTPTALEDDLFEKLLQIVEPYSKGIKEYTIEANPESLSEHKLTLMKQYGVTRLSLGVESTNDQILHAINRHHTFQDVKNAVRRAKDKGFLDINVDLILGLPQANKALLEADLDHILALEVPHISCYSLSVHPHTVFYLRGVEEPLDDYSRELYDIVEKRLTAHGYIHYEVSNWAKPGHESQHNFTYWRDETYYGVGLGASGFIDNYRYTNTKSLSRYNEGIFQQEKEIISYADDEEYYLMLTLRTNEGLSYREYERRFAQSFSALHRQKIEEFLRDGLLTEKDEHLIPTYEGMMVLDAIVLAFLGD